MSLFDFLDVLPSPPIGELLTVLAYTVGVVPIVTKTAVELSKDLVDLLTESTHD